MKIAVIAIFIALLAVLAGCVTPSTVLIGPDGKGIRCASYGYGYVGATMAQGIHDSCIRDAKAAGALPLEEAGGIGIMLTTEASSMRIIRVTQGSPAERAGIKAGDSIVAIDGQPVTNDTDARRLSFGRVNTPVNVTYRSGGAVTTVALMRASFSSLQPGTQNPSSTASMAGTAPLPSAASTITTPPTQAAPTIQPSTITRPTRTAIEPAVAAKRGQYEYNVEKIAASQNCAPEKPVSVTATGPGYESYTVSCPNGESLAVRCDFGTCRALK